MRRKPKEKRLISVRELAAMINVSPQTIYNSTHRRAKKPLPIPVKRIGRLIRFDIADVEAFIKSL